MRQIPMTDMRITGGELPPKSHEDRVAETQLWAMSVGVCGTFVLSVGALLSDLL